MNWLTTKGKVAIGLEQVRHGFEKAVAANPDSQRIYNLTRPLGEVCATAQEATRALSWPLETGLGTAAGPVALKLDIRGGIEAAACVHPPEGAAQPGAGQAGLRLRLTGALVADADAEVPAGRLAVSTQATTEADFEYVDYRLFPTDTQYAEAVASALEGLGTSPFDLAAVAKGFQGGERVCIGLKGRGAISLGGKVALMGPVSLAAAASLSELAYGYTATVEGTFEYQIQPDAAPGRGVQVHLRRSAGNSDEQKAGLKLGLDPASAFQRLLDEAGPYLGQARPLLKDFAPWLEPGTKLREEMKQRIAAMDPTPLKPLLTALYGGEPDSSPTEALVQLLVDEAGIDVPAWLDGAQGRVDALLERLLDESGLPAAQRDAALAALKEQVAKAMEKLAKEADDTLRELAKGKYLDKLGDMLKEADIPVQGALDDGDARLKGLRDLVQRYRERLAELYTTLEAGTKMKIETSLEIVRGHSNQQLADLVLSFDPDSTAARRAYRHALTGSFEAALDLARAGGQGVELGDCTLTRVVKDTEQRKLAVTVLGFDLEMGSLLSAETRIEVDGDGNVSVLSEGAFQRRRKLLDESKTLLFSDVFTLAAAKRTCSLAMKITLSYEDAKMKPEEVDGFFQSLVDAGLLGEASRTKAAGYIRDRDAQAPQGNRQGRLDVGLVLEDAALKRLFDSDGRDNYRDRVMAVAAEKMAAAYLTKDKFILDRLQQAGCVVGPTLEKTILNDITAFVGSGPTQTTPEWTQYMDICRMHSLCVSLADALAAMRSVYEASPDELKGLNWQEKQNEILLNVREGLPGEFPSLFSKEKVRRRTLTLFRILATLAGLYPADPAGRDVLVATMTLGGDKDKQVLRLSA